MVLFKQREVRLLPMKKINILQENLCIKKIISVTQGKNLNHHKLLTINGRHSDAFIYIVSGSCTYTFNDKSTFQANAGDVFYLPYKSVYTMYIHTDDYKFIFCDFDFWETKEKCSAICESPKHKNIDGLFMTLLNLYHASSCSARTECMSILYTIYSILQQDTQKGYLDKGKKEKTKQAKQLIDEGFYNPEFSVSMLAEKINVSEVYLRKLFKAQYGISPSAYLISVRLLNAKKMMKYPFLTLNECAMQSGFSSLQYFCRIFKKENGISPGKYRKNL